MNSVKMCRSHVAPPFCEVRFSLLSSVGSRRLIWDSCGRKLKGAEKTGQNFQRSNVRSIAYSVQLDGSILLGVLDLTKITKTDEE